MITTGLGLPHTTRGADSPALAGHRRGALMERSDARLAALSRRRDPGQGPGKTSQLDTAIRMAMGADFSYRREPLPPTLPRQRGRDDGRLVKPMGAADIALFEQLVRVVNEAQERDAEEERRLYRPMRGAWLSQRERLDPGSRF